MAANADTAATLPMGDPHASSLAGINRHVDRSTDKSHQKMRTV